MSSNLKLASPSFLAGVIALSMSGMLIAGSLQPATAEAGVRMAFADLDHNQDGVIDRTEFDMGVIVSLDTKVADTPFADLEMVAGCRDQRVSRNLTGPKTDETEQVQRTAVFLDEEFARSDSNQDAQISFDEFRKIQRKEMTAQFYDLDFDRNGSLSRTEYTGGLYVEPGFVPGDACVEGVDGETASLMQFVAEGAVAGEDIARAQRINFAAADQNLDGAITLEEFLSR